MTGLSQMLYASSLCPPNSLNPISPNRKKQTSNALGISRQYFAKSELSQTHIRVRLLLALHSTTAGHDCLRCLQYEIITKNKTGTNEKLQVHSFIYLPRLNKSNNNSEQTVV